MQGKEQENLLKELLVEEGLENSMIEIYKTLVETDLEECFPSEQYLIFKNLSKTLFEESEEHRKSVEKIIKNINNHG